MNLKKLNGVVFAASLAVVSLFGGSAFAAPDANVTAATTAATTAFTDSFGTVATMFVTISVTVALVVMAVRWFRKAAK